MVLSNDMKKLIFLFALLFSVNTVFGQDDKPVKIDKLVTVSMPAGYIQKDTLGQHIFSANTDFGYLVATVEPNAKDNQALKREKDLNSLMKNYIRGIQQQSGNGSTQNVRDTTIGNLEAKAFTLVTDDGNGNVQDRNFLVIYTKDATYSFQYAYPDTRKDLVNSEAKAFFGSISLSPELQRDDQYTDINSTSSAGNTLMIWMIAGGIAAVAGGWYLYSRSQRNNELA